MTLIKNQKSPKSSKILEAAVKASLGAGKILRDNFRGKLKISEKKNAGLVTNIDIAAQDKAVGILRKAFPDFGFLTEEADPEASKGLGRWIIDPLDGTTNYVHGFPMFCVSIAAEWNGEMIVGVIYHPILKDIYTTIRGKGAFLNGKRIRVSKTQRLSESLMTTGFNYHKGESLKVEMRAFQKVSETVRAVRRPGSAALDLAYTACGVFDGFWEKDLSPWDIAAGSLLVTEAGGKITDFRGAQCQLDGKEILASNSLLHDDLIREISAES